MTQGILYVVATPIGNLGDITLRALEVLKSVDVIAAEDTRHTSGLLSHFGISKKLFAVHQHNEKQSADTLTTKLKSGENIALVTDAGTPAVSDPGAIVVAAVRAAGLKVVPVPGASAVIAALSASGIIQNGFYFVGFLPSSGAARRKLLEHLKSQTVTLVFYEAPHRIIECVQDIAKILGEKRNITIARELTKSFETIYTCPAGIMDAWLQKDSNQQRGEFVLLVESAPLLKREEISAEAQHVLKCLLAEIPLKQAVKLAAEITQLKKNDLYEFALGLKNAEPIE
jgi:16S rRNA (cytidine1402-2'-O)-methyltransferase